MKYTHIPILTNLLFKTNITSWLFSYVDMHLLNFTQIGFLRNKITQILRMLTFYG